MAFTTHPTRYLNFAQTSNVGRGKRESHRAQSHVHGDVSEGGAQRQELVQEDRDVTRRDGEGRGGRGCECQYVYSVSGCGSVLICTEIDVTTTPGNDVPDASQCNC